MLKLLYPFLLILLLCGTTLAQVSERELKIMEDGKEIRLPDSIQTAFKKDTTALQSLLMKWYAARGFLNAQVDSISPNRRNVRRGCSFELTQLNIRFAENKDSLVSRSNLGSYSEENLERTIRRIIFDLEEEGYPFARSKILHFRPLYTECTLQVTLEVSKGDKLTSTEIYFSGAKSNSQEYLRRISRFSSDNLVNPEFLRSVRSNLLNSGLFRSVGEAGIFLQNGEPLIIYRVQERALNQFEGLLGYVPNAEGVGQIVGSASLNLWNVLLQGNGIYFNYERLKPKRSKLDLAVSQNWIGHLPVGLSTGFLLEQHDTTYQARNFNLDGYYLLQSGIRLTGGVEYQSTTSGSNLANAPEPDGRKQIGRLGFEYATINNYDIPTSGIELKVSWSVANKDLEDDSTAAFIQNVLQFSVLQNFPLFDRSVIVPSVHGFFLEADKVTLHDLHTFGGANSLRGYAEEQFRAGSMVWGDIEYRFMLNRYSYIFGFAAAGGYERPRLLTEDSNTFHVIDYLYSGGLGLSYRTPIGQIRFTYAVSPEESLGNGKIHFGIRTGI